MDYTFNIIRDYGGGGDWPSVLGVIAVTADNFVDAADWITGQWGIFKKEQPDEFEDAFPAFLLERFKDKVSVIENDFADIVLREPE